MSDLLACFSTYCRVVERGSVSGAAIDLDLSQATVSRHLQELEARYRAVLLTRTTRSLQITAAGQQVYDYAKSILRSEAELADRVQSAEQTMQGLITIAGPVGFGHAVLNPFLLEYGKRYPELRIRLLLSERQVNLLEEGVDVAIRIGRLADSAMLVRPLGGLRESLLVAPALLPTIWRPRHPDDLASLPRVALARVGPTRLTGPEGAVVEVDRRAAYEVDSALALRDALLAGRGYGAIHEYLVADALQTGRLVRLLPDWALPVWPVNALLMMRVRPHRIDHFLPELSKALQQLPGFNK